MPTLSEHIRTARKDHFCFLCGEKIETGTQYVHRSGVGDAWWGCSMHIDCAEYAEDTFDPCEWEDVLDGDIDRRDVELHMKKKRGNDG